VPERYRQIALIERARRQRVGITTNLVLQASRGSLRQRVETAELEPFRAQNRCVNNSSDWRDRCSTRKARFRSSTTLQHRSLKPSPNLPRMICVGEYARRVLPLFFPGPIGCRCARNGGRAASSPCGMKSRLKAHRPLAVSKLVDSIGLFVVLVGRARVGGSHAADLASASEPPGVRAAGGPRRQRLTRGI